MLCHGKRETRGQDTWVLDLTANNSLGEALDLSLSLCCLQFQWLTRKLDQAPC